MSSSSMCYWKRLWRWITADNISEEEIWKLLSENNVTEQLRLGLASYRPLQTDKFAELQKKHPDQTQLLSVTQTLQKFLDLDTLQTWDVIMHYLCDDSYGTPADALKNVAFLDARTSRLLPHVWHFYRSERLFLLKLLKYIIEFKDDKAHKYHNEFTKLIDHIGIQDIKTSLLKQFEAILKSSPPARMPHFELGEAYFKQQWVLYNLREQLELLQILLLVVDEVSMSDAEFISMFQQFKKHDFGKRQLFSELLEERHSESCLRIMFSEIALFLVAVDAKKIKSVGCWIESTCEEVETELGRLQQQEHHSALLLAWMLLALSSDKHTSQFESNYAQYGMTALNLQVFKFMHLMITNSIYMDNSKCASLCRMRVYQLLNDTCDKFDGDGSISLQSGVMELCGELLSATEIAEQFWRQLADDEHSGAVSLWNTALEFFPYNFSALSVLSEGLARAGKHSVKKLLQELNSLPVFTQIYRPNSVPLANICLSGNEVVIGKDHYLLNNTYKVTAGSRAAVMERSEATFIHFRTPVSYWTVYNYEIERVLDRRVHNQQEIETVLNKIWEGTKVLKSILEVCVLEGSLPRALVTPSEAALDVLLRFARLEAPPLPLLVACLQSATALARLFPSRVHARLINTGLLPRLGNQSLGPTEYASGASFDSATVGAYLVGIEQRSGSYQFLSAYIDLVCTFGMVCGDERIQREVYLPGVVLVLREVFPNLRGWRYAGTDEKRALTGRCVMLLSEALLTPAAGAAPARALAQRVALHSLLYTENAAELLNIVGVGDQNLQQMMCDESNWVSGPGRRYIATVQRCLSMLMQLLRLKREAPAADVSPLEHLIFAQKHRDSPRVIPNVTTYINHAFNRHLPPLTCRLLNRFASEFQMSLFACLDMTAYQARVLFLERLREAREPPDLKVAVLLFVATCVGKQPGLTEVFFDMRRGGGGGGSGGGPENHSEGVLAYMADYLATVKSSTSCLQSPLLNCIMALFHALWKNNMQVLIRDLTENPTFWEHLTSPLFNEIQPELKAYAQTFNILGIELFLRRDKIDPNLKKTLELFFNTDEKHLDKWIEFIFSFQGRYTTEEVVDEVPTWLGLLTSWKDFTTIFCKCLPIPLNIAHKSKMVSPCMKALLYELEEPSDSRLMIVLAELYVIMLASWQDDCFDNRKANVKQINDLLNYTRMVYESLHPRAKRAILSIGTVAISTLDYEIKANATIAQSIIRSVTNINSTDLDKLYGEMREQEIHNEEEKLNGHVNKDIAPVVLSLAMLEQCLDLYDDMFSSLAQWFQSTRFVNKLLCCLNMCLQDRKHYNTSLAALRCLTAYARGPFSADLLLNDVDQFLWMQLMPPKSLSSEAAGSDVWRPEEWWRVYAAGLDFVSTMVMRHGQFFAREAITFVGVHAESVVEAVLLPRTEVRSEALDVCAAALGLVHQLVRYECRWRMENVNALTAIMRSLSVCVYQCVSLALRSRLLHQLVERPGALDDQPSAPSQKVARTLNRILEIIHTAVLCLLAFSPPLLSLLAGAPLDLRRWEPLVELHFGAPIISSEPFPQLSFGTLLSVICLLTKSLNYTYHGEEASSPGRSRSPRALSARRRPACASPGDPPTPTPSRRRRSESLTSVSSTTSAVTAPWLAAFDKCLVANALEATLTLLASQALLAIRDPAVASRDRQLVRRELCSELSVFHDFVRKRILYFSPSRSNLVRSKLGIWPLLRDEEEARRVAEARRLRGRSDEESEPEPEPEPQAPPPPPPPRRPAPDSMREFVLRKRYLDRAREGFAAPVSHSTPAPDRKALAKLKRVSWAESTREGDEEGEGEAGVEAEGEEGGEAAPTDREHTYSPLTDVQVNNDEDYFHFMSIVLLYICQSEL